MRETRKGRGLTADQQTWGATPGPGGRFCTIRGGCRRQRRPRRSQPCRPDSPGQQRAARLGPAPLTCCHRSRQTPAGTRAQGRGGLSGSASWRAAHGRGGSGREKPRGLAGTSAAVFHPQTSPPIPPVTSQYFAVTRPASPFFTVTDFRFVSLGTHGPLI